MKRLKDKDKPVVLEVYTCVQSEGSRMGYPTIAVRTSGCTHRCFVDVPGRHNPKVFSIDGKVLDIRDVKKGDKLMSWDPDSQSITETQVQDTIQDQVQEYCQVKTEKGTFVVTPEHPFMTTRGWMFAKDLTEKDELIHLGGNLRNSFKMKNHNPMRNNIVKEKVHNHPNYINFSDTDHLSKTHNTRLEKHGTLDPRCSMSKSEVTAFHDRASSRMKDSNPMYDSDTLSRSIESRKNLGWGFKGGMSKVEEKLWTWLQNSDLKDLFWFTGDGGFTVKYDGTVKVPDFKLHGENYFLEVGLETGPKGFRPSWNTYKKQIDKVYSNCHLSDAKVMAININDGKKECLNKIKRFITNGIKIQKVETIKSKKHYNTYNLHCAPFDNFLVNTSKSTQAVVSHNCYFGKGGWCDSWYTSIHPEKAKHSFNDIVKAYDDNPHIKEMMLTGGSPTMHAGLVNELSVFAQQRGILITIETEGSHYLETEAPIGLLSISPKLSNSVPEIGAKTPQGQIVDEKFIKRHNKFRLRYDNIARSIKYHNDFHFKFVMDKEFSAFEEMESFINKVGEELISIGYKGASKENIFGFLKSKTWLMPAGDDREPLFESYGPVMDLCRDTGYKFTGRPHIMAFGTQREV